MNTTTNTMKVFMSITLVVVLLLLGTLYSVDAYKKAIKKEVKYVMVNTASVLIFNDGTVELNWCNDDTCESIILDRCDCDVYGSCLFYLED